MLKRSTCIIWRVNINALNLPSELLFQRLQRQQVIPVDQYVVENVMLTHPVRRMVRLPWVFDENPRLQPWPVVFPNPGEFEFHVLTQRCVPLPWLIQRMKTFLLTRTLPVAARMISGWHTATA